MRKFVEVHNGNHKEAYLDAGYNPPIGDVHKLASQIACKPGVAAALKEKAAWMERSATPEDRKKWWTRVMYDDSAKMSDRLKASELLGKSENDFSEGGRGGDIAIVFIGSKHMTGVEVGGKKITVIDAEAGYVEPRAIETSGKEVQPTRQGN